MNTLRNKEAYQKKISDFVKEVFVVCPSCASKALVKGPGNPYRVEDESKVTLTCTSCGYNRRLSEKPDHYIFRSSRKVYTGKYTCIGGSYDPYFHLPVWLKIDCGNHLLWSYNYDHLSFLENHIASVLRERNGIEKSNKSIGSRLPRWMTSAKNRKEVLKCLEKLKTM